MAKTQKNKATSYHLGQLKAKLAKLKRELLTPTSRLTVTFGRPLERSQLQLLTGRHSCCLMIVLVSTS